MAFKYVRRDAATLEKRATQQGGDFVSIFQDDYKVYQVRDGDNWIRFLPPTWEGADHYALELWVHFGIGPDRATIICPAKMKDERCPICEARVTAERRGDDELAKEMRASKRTVAWIIDRKEEKSGPQLWSMPWTLDRDIAKICKDPRTGEIFWPDDPDNGYDISFEKTGEKLTTKYVGIQKANRPSSVDPDFIEYVASCPIPDTLVLFEYDKIASIFAGGAVMGADTSAQDERANRDPRPEPEPQASEHETEAPKPKFTPRGGAGAATSKPAERQPDPDTRPEPEPPFDRGTARETAPAGGGAQISASERAAQLKARFGRK